MDLSEIGRLGPSARAQIEAQVALSAVRKAGKPAAAGAGKYHAQKTEAAGITFDSKKEACRYAELMLRSRAGEIRELRLQEVFVLSPAYTTPDGVRVRATTYRADFTYRERCVDADGSVSWPKIVEDVKGVRTETYKLKRKMMLAIHGITIREV
jgi:hypothetical protein